jgi:hypothetical protein
MIRNDGRVAEGKVAIVGARSEEEERRGEERGTGSKTTR